MLGRGTFNMIIGGGGEYEITINAAVLRHAYIISLDCRVEVRARLTVKFHGEVVWKHAPKAYNLGLELMRLSDIMKRRLGKRDEIIGNISYLYRRHGGIGKADGGFTFPHRRTPCEGGLGVGGTPSVRAHWGWGAMDRRGSMSVIARQLIIGSSDKGGRTTISSGSASLV